MLFRKSLVTVLILLPILAFGQHTILIEAKSSDPKRTYHLRITKSLEEIKIVQQRADSVKKEIALADQQMIKSLMDKPASFFDSLSKDSIAMFQNRLDSIQRANTIYQSDSTSIYKKSHPAYWKLTEQVLRMPNDNLEAKAKEKEETTYFVTIKNEKDTIYIVVDSSNLASYPLLAKLITGGLNILAVHRKVMEKRNQ